MISATDFVLEFLNYQTCCKRLQFLSPPYKMNFVESSAHPNKIFENDTARFVALQEPLSNPSETRRFGGITLSVWSQVPKTLFIENIYTHDGQASDDLRSRGYGREILRRTVLFAKAFGFEKVETSEMAPSAVSFWLGMGFLSDPPLMARWKDAPDEQTAGEWRLTLHERPEKVWDFARTEVGRRVLQIDKHRGILNLKDRYQISYVSERLRLNLEG